MMYPILLLIVLSLLCIKNNSYSLNYIYSKNIRRLYRKHEKNLIIKCTTEDKAVDSNEPKLDDLVSKLTGTPITIDKIPDGPIVWAPNPASYITCSACKTNYLMPEAELGKKGMRVRCIVCEKEWFQTTDRLMVTDGNSAIRNMTETAIVDLKRILAERAWPKYQRIPKFDIFIGNLPYTYTEKELGDLFGEYGVTGVSLVKDPAGMSKGFGFIEVATKEDADKLVAEMHHFYTDGNRRLTVRLAAQPGEPRTPREPRAGGPGGSFTPREPRSGPGGGGGGSFATRGGNNGGSSGGRSYSPRK